MTTTIHADADRKSTSLQCLSGNTLKIIAAICMLVDHVTKVFFASIAGRIINPALVQGSITLSQLKSVHFVYDNILLGIGAVSFPIFAFLFAESLCHTRNKTKLLLRLLLFALISEFPFDATFFRPWGPKTPGWPWYRFHQNVFFTYVQAFCTLWLIQLAQKAKCKAVALPLKGGILCISLYLAHSVIMGDYGEYGILLILAAYWLRKNRMLQIVGMLIIKLFDGFDYIGSSLIALMLLLLYNGKRGRCNHKYFFYIFYPAHIAILGLLNWLIFVVLWNTSL